MSSKPPRAGAFEVCTGRSPVGFLDGRWGPQQPGAPVPFPMSKLGYLASRAPSAMFSQSRYTAMVASAVRVVRSLHCPILTVWRRHRPEFAPAVRNTQAGKLRCIALIFLKPVVVEAHTERVRPTSDGTPPRGAATLEQNHLSGHGGQGDPRPVS